MYTRRRGTPSSVVPSGRGRLVNFLSLKLIPSLEGVRQTIFGQRFGSGMSSLFLMCSTLKVLPSSLK